MNSLNASTRILISFMYSAKHLHFYISQLKPLQKTFSSKTSEDLVFGGTLSSGTCHAAESAHGAHGNLEQEALNRLKSGKLFVCVLNLCVCWLCVCVCARAVFVCVCLVVCARACAQETWSKRRSMASQMSLICWKPRCQDLCVFVCVCVCVCVCVHTHIYT